MLFLFQIVSAAINDIVAGLEYSRNSTLVIKNLSDGNSRIVAIKKNHLEVCSEEPRESSKPSLNAIYRIHDLFEEDFSLDTLAGCSGDTGRTTSSLESQLSDVSVASLFFSEYVPMVRHIVVSSPDYFTPEQSKKLAQAFINLKIQSKVVPESTCFVVHKSSFIKQEDTSKTTRVAVLNTRGSKAVESVFEISVSGKAQETNDKEVKNEQNAEKPEEAEKGEESISNSRKKSVSITLIDRKHVDIPSDREVEMIVVDAFKNYISNRSKKDILCLPYDIGREADRKHEYLCDITNHVTELIGKLGFNISCYTSVELLYYPLEGDAKRVLTDIKIELAPIREAIAALISSRDVTQLESNVQEYCLLSDNSYYKTLLEGNIRENNKSVPLSAETSTIGSVSNGAFTMAIQDFLSVTDAGIVAMSARPSAEYTAIIDEITSKKKASSIYTALQGLMEDADDLMKNIASEYIEPPKGLAACKKLLESYSAAEKKIMENIRIRTFWEQDFQAFENLLKTAKNTQPTILEELSEVLKASEEWLAAHRTVSDPTEELLKELKKKDWDLRIQLNRIKRKIAKEEEAAKKAAEKAKKAEEDAKKAAEKAKEEEAAGDKPEEVTAEETAAEDKATDGKTEETAGEEKGPTDKNIFHDAATFEDMYSKLEELLAKGRESPEDKAPERPEVL